MKGKIRFLLIFWRDEFKHVFSRSGKGRALISGLNGAISLGPYTKDDGIEFRVLIFLSGKQSSRKARKETCSNEKVRIYVERAIKRLKEFRVFHGNIPLTSLQLIVIVCA